MQLSRKLVETDPQPNPAILIEAAVSSVKPSALIAVETTVAELRGRRSELSKKFNNGLDQARRRAGGALTSLSPDLAQIEKDIARVDGEIREARAEMLRRRTEFTRDFNRVTGEFRKQAAENIRAAMPALMEAFEILVAVEQAAQRAGIEFNHKSPAARDAIQMLRGLSK